MFDICGHMCQNVAFALACFDSACQNVVWRDRYLGEFCHTFVMFVFAGPVCPKVVVGGLHLSDLWVGKRYLRR